MNTIVTLLGIYLGVGILVAFVGLLTYDGKKDAKNIATEIAIAILMIVIWPIIFWAYGRNTENDY